jgi:hypothetical protein
VTLIVVMVLARLFAALLLDGRSLLDTRVMALELHSSVGREVEDVLHGLPVEELVSEYFHSLTARLTES